MSERTLPFLLALVCFAAAQVFADRPNVILIMTDDQGYGDLACHGNPVLKTPELDRLHAESVRLTNFHVSPFCTPTRAALMTGRYPARTGAYRTASGRCMLHTDERTIAEEFADAGYVTGMVGKWHLGDNAPHRPQDRGFQDVVWHHAGGIGQAADYYGNTYFNDTYERNGTFEKFEGYCTDVFFAESMRFVEENTRSTTSTGSGQASKPFFLYLAPNAPHSPYHVAPEWSAPYKESVKWKGGAEFYGMISNIDYNLGRLRERLEKLGIAENTILIFMTDNGTSNGIARKELEPGAYRGFNAGVRGVKSTVYEGGHRVPFFIHWPKGGLVGGRDDARLAAHIDVLPTLAELCDISLPVTPVRDGVSFADLLNDPDAPACREHLVVQLQGGARFANPGQKWKQSCVIKGDWRLIDGEKLINCPDDPMQGRNLATAHPERVEEMRSLYEAFWKAVSPGMTPVSIDLGSPAENPTELCSQDWYMQKGNPPWHYGAINNLVRVTGPWHVDVKQAGRYRLTLRQYPEVANKPVIAERAKVSIAGQEMEQDVESGSKGVIFEVDLPAGKTTLETWLYDEKDEAGGAYFTEVEFLQPAATLDVQPSPDDRAAWLDEDKFGLFIHWGLYSQLAKGEWVMHAKKIPIEEYSKLTETCNPTKFNAGEWVRIAKDAGMKYIVISSKHHDGFALFDSKVSDYNIVQATPFKRDMIAELKKACDAEGIKLGLYYSHAQDWYHRGGFPSHNWKNPSGMDEMKDYLNNISLPQVKELLTQYKPAILWYDTPRRMNPGLAKPFAEVVRDISPGTLINSRIALDGNKMDKVTQKDLDMLKSLDTDYLSYADREIPANSPWNHWETCMTLNGSWGFTKGDNAWKTPSHVVQQLLEVVSKNGAFLLNVGPTADGEFPAASVTVLKQVGDWLKLNGDTVYGAKPVSFNLAGTPTAESLKRKAAKEARFAKLNRPAPHTSLERDFPWIATRKGKTIFIAVFEWPADNSLVIEKFTETITDARLASNPDAPLQTRLDGETLRISLPRNPGGDLPPVIRLSL